MKTLASTGGRRRVASCTRPISRAFTAPGLAIALVAFAWTLAALTTAAFVLTPIAVAQPATPPAATLPPLTGEGSIVSGDFVTAIVIDAQTGDVLFSRNPHGLREPASMIKMMTELIVLEKIAAGQLALTDSVEVSANSSRTGGSQVYLKEGERFTVEELLMALAIHSANDAAVALAEHVGGSIEGFVDLMNIRAQELGLSETTFRSPHGLPPDRGELPDISSAYDMALLGRTLIQHPEAQRWGSTAEAPFRNGTFTLHSPNAMIGKFRGLEGIKTGYHREAGYCVTASATRQGKRIIAVVMGSSSNKERAAEASRLLSLAFNLYTDVKLVTREKQPLDEQQAVKGGKLRSVGLVFAKPLTVSVRRDQASAVTLERELPKQIKAPVAEGQEIGTAVAKLDGRVLGEVPIVAAAAVPRGNIFQRLFQK
jgi:serine-type D-Ala-D-Ala carboxypeptidase (penicillin-binding protein 5/6)